jgi:DNA-binding NtrC family response regulator
MTPEQEEPTPHVLIVDDEDGVRSALRRSLRRENYRLTFATSAAEALQRLHEEQPDVILSDHLMPGMTGVELLKRCRLLYPDVGRIVLTGQAEMETVVDAINQGEVFRFLRKPWDDDDLKLTLHLAISHVRLERENRRLLKLLEHQALQIRQLEAEHPGIGRVRRDASGAIVIDEDELGAL